jgi:glycosyltransferase involved in cell wall biosynthesis
MGFLSILRDAKSVIVNSQCARHDIARFFPWVELARVTALPFAPILPSEWVTQFGVDMWDTYALPQRYFVVSNQFWVHKDHPTAIRALKLLRQRLDVGLVLTGASVDWRRPGYLEEVRKIIRDHQLDDNVRILGHLPKRHQVEIMKGAIAVVQPTLFEGGPGGGCVYDAVALGLPIILSDIPVNREVISGFTRFFTPSNAESLASAMDEVANSHVSSPNYQILIQHAQDRAVCIGTALFSAIDRAVAL